MIDTLDRKIRQMHAALAGLATDDLSAIQPQITSEDGYVYTKADFNRNSDPIALANAASLLIANIASIKDHLKLWCKKQNMPFQGDALINSNVAVALVHDLWNTDKHAELNTPPRSGHKPRLKDLKTVLSISAGAAAGGGAFFSMDPRTGKVTTGTSGGGTVQLALNAKIVDDVGNVLGDFTQTCAQAVEAWSDALSTAGVSLP
jgi:hypothetical protein